MKVCLVCAIHRHEVPLEHPTMDYLYLGLCEECGEDRCIIELPEGYREIKNPPTDTTHADADKVERTFSP